MDTEEALFVTIETRHGPVDVYSDCRVKVFDAFWATELSMDGLNHEQWLLPQDFTNEQWKTLRVDEKLYSYQGQCALLERRVNVLERKNNEKLALLIAAVASIVSLFAAAFGW